MKATKRIFNALSPSGFQYIPGDLSPGMRFHDQCAHWLWKHHRKSAGRPEIREDFRPAQILQSR
jgi:hypothetical protein